jgi:hypothetical protein
MQENARRAVPAQILKSTLYIVPPNSKNIRALTFENFCAVAFSTSNGMLVNLQFDECTRCENILAWPYRKYIFVHVSSLCIHMFYIICSL